MMTYRNLLLILTMMLVTGSCRQKGHYTSVGKPFDIVIVVPVGAEHDPCATLLRHLFSQPMEGVPQIEKSFAVSLIPEDGFGSGFRQLRNILIVRLDKSYGDKTRLRIQRDAFAAPQIVAEITASSIDKARTYVAKNGRKLYNLFVRAELDRLVRNLCSRGSFVDTLASRVGIRMSLLPEIDAMHIDSGVVWLSSHRTNVVNVCAYAFPYVSDKVFSVDSFVRHSNTVLPCAVRGAHENAGLRIDERTVVARSTAVDGRYVQEYRGLWHMDGEPMGGPFIAHMGVDTVRGRIVAVMGFVWSPGKSKRIPLRRLEASLHTMRF